MKPHVLIAVDAFTDEHINRIKAALGEWATCERIPEETPSEAYQVALQQAHMVMGWPEPEWVVSSSVKFLQLPSVGYDGYLGKGLEAKTPFILCNATGVMGKQIAEHVAGMVFALTRRIGQHVRDQQAGVWRQAAPYGEINGATLCVVGLGDIGTEIVRWGLSVGMRVIGVRKDASKGHSLVERVYPIGELKAAVAQADHVVSILPGGADTAQLYDADVFAHFKPGAYFYNVGRGRSVDESALIAALQSGHLGGAGLDVFQQEPLPVSSPFWQMNNVIITPHVAGRSVREFDRMCDLFVSNLAAYQRGERLRNVVLATA
jgi:phosphoglycerate dehydrogenase-like enzyme